eukprot:gene10550-14166_t
MAKNDWSTAKNYNMEHQESRFLDADSSALLVLNDSPLRKLPDLKGRRVAVQKGSSAHYLLVRAVDKAGLQWADIQPVYLAPADARAAFE